MKRWEPAAPLVILPVRSSHGPAVGAAVSFLTGCLARASEETGDCGGRLLPMAAWQYAVLTDAPEAFHLAWKMQEEEALPSNVELILLEAALLNSVPGERMPLSAAQACCRH